MGLKCGKEQYYDAYATRAEEFTSRRKALHSGPIFHVQQLEENWVVACSDDKTISIVDCQALQQDPSYIPRYMKGHTKAVSRLLVLDKNTVVSASRDLTIRKVSKRIHPICIYCDIGVSAASNPLCFLLLLPLL
ncbi:hypothetical protein EON64_16455 [archaeon]|nr:MAG: hypothetical protein EON64_16455 [archaeon]